MAKNNTLGLATEDVEGNISYEELLTFTVTQDRSRWSH